ncbi:zinc finger, C2H2 type, partial [Cooperia oncophora]
LHVTVSFRVCRSVFRSFVNFCSHKRGFCRSEAHEKHSSGSNNARDDALIPKRGASLRRTNLAKHVMKRVDVVEIPGPDDIAKPSYVHTLPAIRREVVAVIGADGTTQIHAPSLSSSTTELDPDRVLLLRPQDNPSRYRGMSLRLRLKEDATRVISKDEAECVERLMKYLPGGAEPTLGRCLYASCADVAPFGSMHALAYHMSVKHHKREKSGKAIPCLMCPKKFTTWKFFYSHIKKKHGHIKSEHIAYRKKEADESIARRKAKKLKLNLPGDGLRSRSLSPECSGAIRDQRELDGTDVQNAGNCSVLPIDETLEKDEEMKELEEEHEDLACISTAPSSENTQKENKNEQKQVKTKKCRTGTPPVPPDNVEERHSSMSLRERRKRKIPARYRDDDVVLTGSDGISRSRRSSTSLCPSTEPPSKPPTPTAVSDDLIMKVVTKVMNRMLFDVDMSSHESSSSPLPMANVRMKSSRLRKRPDWMDNEDFIISRREGSSDHSVMHTFNNKDSLTNPTIPKEATPPPAHSTPTKVASVNNVTSRSRRNNWSPSDPSYSPSSRRKQNLNVVNDDVDDVTILSKYGRPGKPCDLAMVPVYLSGAQKQQFFSSLRQLDPNEPDGKHVCSQCKEVVPNLKEGRRHMVTHIRVMRLRCSLCGAGSFFCTDLRVHLMEGHCEKLHRAPEGVVKPNTIPCMTKEQADSLSELADPVNPGRVMYTSGQIVSAKSRTPYYPDPVIEERILGPGRIGRRLSPARPKNRP